MSVLKRYQICNAVIKLNRFMDKIHDFLIYIPSDSCYKEVVLKFYDYDYLTLQDVINFNGSDRISLLILC